MWGLRAGGGRFIIMFVSFLEEVLHLRLPDLRQRRHDTQNCGRLYYTWHAAYTQVYQVAKLSVYCKLNRVRSEKYVFEYANQT